MIGLLFPAPTCLILNFMLHVIVPVEIILYASILLSFARSMKKLQLKTIFFQERALHVFH
jgi:hypothetical protein